MHECMCSILRIAICSMKALHLTAGKLLDSSLPLQYTRDASAAEVISQQYLIAAARDHPCEADACSHAPDHADQAASMSLEGASSIENHLALSVSESNTTGRSTGARSQNAQSQASSLAGEPQGADLVGERGSHQHAGSMPSSRGGSVYSTPQASFSSKSQGSTERAGLGTAERNPLYACSSSGASTGIDGGHVNPCYACSASSASSGSALPQRQRFWPRAAPAAPSMPSVTAQSIPEADASEVQHLLLVPDSMS